ncbi:MAG: ABC transporter ATP-binding protein [Candidatus Brocadiales bacterium]|nr:ABC transporter ATP-binding protein [Candidatus Brocadiales bacterium]
MSEPLLEVTGLKTYFFLPPEVIRAVDVVSFSLFRGETLALVGESGCGKSVSALSILRLLPHPPAKILSGRIGFRGTDILKLSKEEMRRIRGKEISMIFQEPMSSLNPLLTVGEQIIEAVLVHLPINKKEAKERAVEMLRKVGIPDPEQRQRNFPHELSGGMRQRVMIAMALICNPSLLIADEPTTALDVTIQAQVLHLLRGLQEDSGMAILLITHDLGMVAEIATSVAVMYAGRIVEGARAEELFQKRLHPYTRGLFMSLPQLARTGQRLFSIAGSVPDMADLPRGCRFWPRCPEVREVCRESEPELKDVYDGHKVACWLFN